jgi:hypothetical protein
MFKHSVPIVYEVRPASSKSKLPRILSILASGALLAPLAAEGAAICYVQWCEIMGKSAKVQTPIIDSIGSGLLCVRDLLADSFGSTFQRAIHEPTIALPVASVLLVLAMAVLRR